MSKIANLHFGIYFICIYNTINITVYVCYTLAYVVRIFSIVTRDMERKKNSTLLLLVVSLSTFATFGAVLHVYCIRFAAALCVTCTQSVRQSDENKPKPAAMETVRPPVLTNAQPPSFHFQSAAYHMVHAVEMRRIRTGCILSR